MKTFAITLSLYILVLSFVPCGDGRECNEIEEVKISASSDHDHHKHDEENCTPFCICSCCGTSMISLNIPEILSEIEQVYVIDFPVYIESPLSVTYFHIWQPPKIS